MSDTKIKVITQVCRSSYMFVNKLEEDDNGTKKCKTAILIPKKNKKTIKAIQAAIEAASQKKFSKKAVKNSSKWSYPLRDGDAELESGELEVENPKDYEGHYFLSATAYKIPQLVNNENERVEDFEEHCKASRGLFFVYEKARKGDFIITDTFLKCQLLYKFTTYETNRRGGDIYKVF